MNKQADSTESSRAADESSPDPALLSGRVLVVDDDADYRRSSPFDSESLIVSVIFLALMRKLFDFLLGILKSTWRCSITTCGERTSRCSFGVFKSFDRT